MLTSKGFWIGFALAYLLAVFFPPQKFFGGGGKPSAS